MATAVESSQGFLEAKPLDYAESRNQLLRRLTYFSVFLWVVGTVMGFVYPGADAQLGESQRIFYIHLGSFGGSFVTFAAAMVAGFAYLRTRNPKWDTLALASVEIGLAMSAINIVTGAIWARPTWGTYWTWDPRLTTVAIMWLTYAAYLFLRSAIEDPERRFRFASIYGILAFGSVILTVVIIRIRPDAIHPDVVGPSVNNGSAVGEFRLSPSMTQTVLFNIFAYIVVSVALVWHRIRLENRTNWVKARKLQILSES